MPDNPVVKGRIRIFVLYYFPILFLMQAGESNWTKITEPEREECVDAAKY